MRIRNVQDLADYLDSEPTEESLSRRVYKSTSCGAWLSLFPGGVSVGSIVEGVDQTTITHSLCFPFSKNEFFEMLEAIEEEADEIWNNTHGCEKCGPVDPMTGYTPVNPGCKACHGAGAII